MKQFFYRVLNADRLKKAVVLKIASRTTFFIWMILMSTMARAADDEFDFAIGLSHCRMVVASNAQPDDASNIKSTEYNLKTLIMCKHGPTVKCDFFDDKTKLFASIELKIIVDALDSAMELSTETRSTKISINKITHTAVTLDNVLLPERSDISGVKVCVGSYSTSKELRESLGLKEKKDKKPKK